MRHDPLSYSEWLAMENRQKRMTEETVSRMIEASEREGRGTRNIERDPEYDYVPPHPTVAPPKKGRQCGKCGKKFDYGVPYGYCCPYGGECPAGWG